MPVLLEKADGQFTPKDEDGRWRMMEWLMVQMGGEPDNSYQQRCLRQHQDRLVSVVVVDAASPGALDHLSRLAEQGARHRVGWLLGR